MLLRLTCVALLLAGTGGCNGRSGERPANPPVTNPPDASGSTGTTMAKQPTITAKITAINPGRPPLARLTVGVTIDNQGDTPRWVKIAQQIPPDDGAGGGVDRVEIRGTAPALIATFFGTGGFHAVRVAARSKATITNLAVAWWQSSPTAAMPDLDVAIAADLKLGAEAASVWFGGEPLLGDGVTVDAGGDVQHEHRTDGKEAGVELVGGEASTVTLEQ